MVHTKGEIDASSIWFLDGRCSNYMIGYKHLFEELDETHKLKVKLGDDKLIQVEGKGTIAVCTNQNGMKYLYNIYFIPELSRNLLSIEHWWRVGIQSCLKGILVQSWIKPQNKHK